jgi:hypothetical protein
VAKLVDAPDLGSGGVPRKGLCPVSVQVRPAARTQVSMPVPGMESGISSSPYLVTGSRYINRLPSVDLIASAVRSLSVILRRIPTEGKFVAVAVQVLRADVMKAANNAAF